MDWKLQTEYENLKFLWFFLSIFVAVSALDKADALTSKNNVTAEPNNLQMH